jgi:hypothetical protein
MSFFFPAIKKSRSYTYTERQCIGNAAAFRNKEEEERDMSEEIRKLSEDELDGVSGGAIFNASNIIGSNKDKPWEVLDDKGNIVRDKNGNELRFASRDDAVAAAATAGVGWDEVNWNWVVDRRK